MHDFTGFTALGAPCLVCHHYCSWLSVCGSMVDYSTIIGGLVYVFSITILQSYCIFTFPGFINNGSFT